MGKDWEKRAEGVERNGFAQQMGIGGEIDGQVFKEIAAVLIQRREEAFTELRGHGFADKLPEPDPRYCPESHFESAGPIDAALKRVLGEPGFELSEDLVKILGFAGKQMGLGQENKMLMTVEFPDEFVVAHCFETQIFDATEVIRGRGFLRDVVATPIYIRTGFDGESQ